MPPPPPPLPTITVSTTADVVDPTTNLTNAQTPNVTKEKTVSSISTTKQPQLASEPKRNLVTEKSDGNVPSLPITKERENITSTKKPTSLMKPSSQLFGGRKTTALAADYGTSFHGFSLIVVCVCVCACLCVLQLRELMEFRCVNDWLVN